MILARLGHGNLSTLTEQRRCVFWPNDMRQELFLSCVNKHAQLKLKSVRNKRSPWITG